ncbi:hypothetical protein CcaCcLH18_13067 [Colletotrichum camelliae]|nr:hypothetical protein CcaCcLH18_13067 [Colletotrichum camelliae]
MENDKRAFTYDKWYHADDAYFSLPAIYFLLPIWLIRRGARKPTQFQAWSVGFDYRFFDGYIYATSIFLESCGRYASATTLRSAVSGDKTLMVHEAWAVTWDASDTPTLTPQLPTLTNSMWVPVWTPGEEIPDGRYDVNEAKDGHAMSKTMRLVFALKSKRRDVSYLGIDNIRMLHALQLSCLRSVVTAVLFIPQMKSGLFILDVVMIPIAAMSFESFKCESTNGAKVQAMPYFRRSDEGFKYNHPLWGDNRHDYD